MRLYRPVGQKEMDLIANSNYTKYPPRLPEQPIFYPVLNEKYAREIADKWNKKSADSGYAGAPGKPPAGGAGNSPVPDRPPQG